MMNSTGKTEKMHGQKLLNPSESRMVGRVYNKAANAPVPGTYLVLPQYLRWSSLR